MSIDFTKAEIGQKVNDPRLGNGIITEIDPRSERNFRVTVNFKIADGRYTSDGRCFSTECPTLRVGHFDPIDQGSLPKKKPKSLVFDGTPKWAYVGDYSFRHEDNTRRRVVAGNQDIGWLAVKCEKDNTESVSVSEWKYAWEVEDD